MTQRVEMDKGGFFSKIRGRRNKPVRTGPVAKKFDMMRQVQA